MTHGTFLITLLVRLREPPLPSPNTVVKDESVKML